MNGRKRHPFHIRTALVLWLAGLSIGTLAGGGLAFWLNTAHGAIVGGR